MNIIKLTIIGTAIVLASHLAEASSIVLDSQNTVILNGMINADSVSQVIRDARALDTPKLVGKPIYLFLYTPGGEIQTGLEMLEALKGLTRPVHTVTLFAASMGFQTVQNLGRRYIVKSGVLMSHHAHGGVEGEFGGLGISQMQARLGLWERRITELDHITVARTNGLQTLESYQTAYDHELWLNADEAVSGGYADEEVQVKCDPSLNGVLSKTASGPFGISISYELDKCPINTTPMNVKINIPTTEGDKESGEFARAGGGFGASCLIAKGAKTGSALCAANTSITADLITEVRSKFKDRFTSIRTQVQ